MVATPSYRLKFDRACEHLNALERAERGEEPHPYLLAHEPDPDGSGHIVRVQQLALGMFGCLIGDCVHNFRSALDHLALELAVAYTNPLPAGYEEGSEFPIFSYRPMSPDEEAKRIGCVAPTAQTIIKDLQPHQRGQGYRTDPLWQLNELDRIDKHRSILLTEFRGMRVGLSGRNVEVEQLQMVGKGSEVQSGAIVASYRAAPVEPDTEMEMNLRLQGQVAFKKVTPFPSQPVVPVLQGIRCHLEQHVIPPLEIHL